MLGLEVCRRHARCGKVQIYKICRIKDQQDQQDQNFTDKFERQTHIVAQEGLKTNSGQSVGWLIIQSSNESVYIQPPKLTLDEQQMDVAFLKFTLPLNPQF